MMKKYRFVSLFYLFLTAFGGMMPAAAETATPVRAEYQRWSRCVSITFAEPVASMEQVRVSHRQELSLADRGLDKFTVTGDDAHRPKLFWSDQDELCIAPAEGTPAGTEFRLTVAPGQTYLGGAEITPREYVFTFPGPDLCPQGLVGIPGLGVVMAAEKPENNIVCPPLAPDCGVRYTFAEVKRKDEDSPWKETGRTVGGHAEPLRLKHNASVTCDLIAREPSLKPETLTAESILPGAVLVVPDEPLPEEADRAWKLCYDPATTGYSPASPAGPYRVKNELTTFLSVAEQHEEGESAPATDGRHRVALLLSDAVETRELPRLFAAMHFRLGDSAVRPDQPCTVEAGEVTDENGKPCRRAEWKGKVVTFTYEGTESSHLGYENHMPNVDGKGQLDYRNPALATVMLVSVETSDPLTLEAVVPDGTLCSALGKPQKGEHRHRLTLNPAVPTVQVTDNYNDADILLPRSGEGKLGLTVFSSSRLEITPTFFSPQAVADTREAWKAFRRQAEEMRGVEMTDPEGYWACRRALSRQYGLSREQGLFDAAEQMLRERKQRKEWYAAQKEYERYRRQLVKLGETAAPSVFELPGGAKGSVQQTVELKSLIGSAELKPGLYLLHLKLTPNAAADEAGRALGCKKSCIEGDVVVRVQGLKLSLSSDMAVVHRLADGALVEEATLVTPWNREPTAVKHGVAVCPLRERRNHNGGEVVVLAGDDWGSAWGDGRSRSQENAKMSAHLLSDRRFYRPGEKVHVYGMVRRVLPNGHSECAGDVSGLRISVRRPDRKKLLTQALSHRANGTFETEFTLPDGEEDVTGSYMVELEDAKGRMQSSMLVVESQVFRRDAFTLTADLAVAKVAPDHLTYTLTATDLNGTPLANAKVQLELYTGYNDDLTAGAEKTTRLTTEQRTDAEGKLVWNCPLQWAAVKPDASMESPVRLRAVVRNDREEVREIDSSVTVYRTNFCVQEPVENRLRLVSAEDEKKPLPHEQVLHARITCPDEERTELPNGFAWVKETERTLWEGDLRFPAHDEEGVDLPELPEQPNKRSSLTTLYLTGRDSAGREYRRVSRRYYRWNRDLNVFPTAAQDALEVTAEKAGQAYLLVQHGEELGTPLPLTLKRGQQRIPLAADLLPAGSSALFLLQPTADKKGFYTALQGDSARIIKPDPARALQVSLTLPQGAVRPAAEVAVSGSVQTPDGQPAKAAVLLFAVDEGMLMGTYALPDWESVFLHHTPIFSLPSRNYVLNDRKGEAAVMLPGLWQGNTWKNGRWTTLASVGLVPMADVDVDVEMDCCEEEGAVFSAAPASAVAGGAAVNGVKAMKRAVAPVAAPCMAVNLADGLAEAAPAEGGAGDAAAAPAPRLRNNFEPVAVWAATLTTDAEGHFATTFKVPDTLTTYKVFCVAADDGGDRFANHTEKLQVNQPVMLTPATPFFMSSGDRLLLPLTVTNATDTADTWQVSLQGGGTQPIRLDAHATGTLYFEIAPQQEGEQVLQWTARSASGADAVEGRFPVRYPAPLLKEVHHLVLDKTAQGEGVSAELKPAALPAPELADSTRGELWVEMSANPLLHLADCVDFLVQYPYGCTEQISTGLLPWLMYDRLAPFCAPMAEKSPAEAATMVNKAVTDLLKRQQRDGGLSYWSGGRESCFWASAHAALVLTLAQETQHNVPADKLAQLCAYVQAEKAKLQKKKEWEKVGPLLKYEVARVLNDRAGMNAALAEALQQDAERNTAVPRPFYCWVSPSVRADLLLLQAVQSEGGASHAAFLTWLRYRARDYRHPGTWTGAWTLLALHEYLAQLPPAEVNSSITLPDGRTLELNNGVTRLKLADYGTRLDSVKDLFSAAEGTTYVTVKAKALPQQTEYPGVTEKGLQITRLYEKKGSDGVWRPVTEFGVGDVVRVTLTCAKGDRDIDYFVLEDYLPACMEAVNPAIPTQAAGIEFVPWSAAFDNKEYLRDRVRGFCTRWTGRNVLNMVYFARVKYAGSATAPPAQAQLMYEPQVYGLSPNTKVNAK